jgi:hypothetical protein
VGGTGSGSCPMVDFNFVVRMLNHNVLLSVSDFTCTVALTLLILFC